MSQLPHPRLQPRHHQTILGGLSCSYLEWGPVDAPAVVMIHGLRSYAYTWEELAADLARDHRVLALDLRGRGDSAWDPDRRYHHSAYLHDLAQWVDGLQLRRFTLLGHSLGGAVALMYAGKHSDRVASLIIEDSGPGAAAAGAGAERIAAELASTPTQFDSLDGARAYWRSIRPNISDTALDSRVRHTLKQLPDGRYRWRWDHAGISDARRTYPPVNLWPSLELLACPTLLVRGGRSDYCTAELAEQMRKRQPLLEIVTIGDAGHYVHDDQPERFSEQVRAFLTRHQER
ncbi:alpha/beta fold hydrolase [Nocardia pseudovaccinii]|uniref:alpha/beta fold hydrolase n=1 Tax=Nocardia pseudovaccinii TaxID=189540 RepID=UPI003D91EF30